MKTFNKGRKFRPVLWVSACLWIGSAISAYAQSAEYVVFELTGEPANFALGDVLKDGDRIELEEGMSMALLDKAGVVTKLEGPFVGTVEDESDGSGNETEDKNALNVISRLMFGNKELVSTLGAARALDSVKTDDGKSQPWVPVISKPGTYCISMTDPVFGRRNADKKAKLTLFSGSEIFKELVWDENKTQISIKDAINPDIDRYTLFLSGQAKESTLHLLDRTDMNTTQQIAWMAERGCKAQAMQLLTKVAENTE